jgi:hypothetical protein
MILKQYLWLAAAVGLLASHVGLGWYAYSRGHSTGEADGKAAVAKQIKSQYESAINQLSVDLQVARELNASLRESLADVPPSTIVREVIRDNPSGCPTPAPVARSLQEHAARIDAVLAAGRGRGSLPAPGAGGRAVPDQD